MFARGERETTAEFPALAGDRCACFVSMLAALALLRCVGRQTLISTSPRILPLAGTPPTSLRLPTHLARMTTLTAISTPSMSLCLRYHRDLHSPDRGSRRTPGHRALPASHQGEWLRLRLRVHPDQPDVARNRAGRVRRASETSIEEPHGYRRS
jgi:hypothetical protein